MSTLIRIGIVAAAGLMAVPAPAQEALRLALPLACEPGRTCFIQHYVDVDAGPGVQDFRCGSATYEGHKGVDFRVLSAAAARRGVAVLAAASGVVKGVRDGMADAFAREAGKAAVADRECGNGVVVDHGGGWETQYCHMRQDSVTVKSGERLQRGQRLGDVGWSGLADFAHLHLSVRKDGKVVDPFTGGGQTGTCAREAGGSGMWEPGVVQAFPYRNGEIFDIGLAEQGPGWAALELDHESVPRPTTQSAALLVYARLTNARQGDRIRFTIEGPGGVSIRLDSEPVPRNRPIHLAYAGQRRSLPSWPAGRYSARAELLREGASIARREAELDLE